MYSHLSFMDKVKLEQLLLSKMFLKKNGKQNISVIAKFLNRHRSTILREIKRFKTIKEYSAYKSDKMYYKKRKKNNKRCKFTEEQINFMKIKLNKYRDAPREFIYRYFLKFDNCGKLTDFKSIWDIENKVSNVGGFEMDTVVGKDHQSAVLVLVEQSSKNYFVMKLKNHTAREVEKNFKDIVINNNLIGKIKGIITDRGKKNLLSEEKWKYLLKHKYIFVMLINLVKNL
ncbi:transposase of is30 family protein [Spiroplasma phoeniceum P40]|uniref:Transposase of is30 family protein n=1 Tax=Spiroplasma phoeniceum P40 TaxID=1276259 RepID=A0A345DP47_9MOLU|nr:transposase of is30 family protein [Spiroplasma phoeniceum P40]